MDLDVGHTREDLIQRLWCGIDPFSGAVASPERVDLQGWSGSRHPWLEQAIAESRPRLIVEIGVWKGASALFMADALRRHNVAGVVIAIDTWLGSAEHRTRTESFSSLRVENGQPTIQQTFMANAIASGLQDYVIPLPMDSLNAANLFNLSKLSADVVHIDAGHDMKSVTSDIEAWWPLMRPGGILIGDDYHADGRLWPEVKAAFDAFTFRRKLSFDHSPPKIRLVKPVTP